MPPYCNDRMVIPVQGHLSVEKSCYLVECDFLSQKMASKYSVLVMYLRSLMGVVHACTRNASLPKLEATEAMKEA